MKNELYYYHHAVFVWGGLHFEWKYNKHFNHMIVDYESNPYS